MIVMNELAKRGYEGIGSDIKEVYSGISDGTAVETMPYVQMDITDRARAEKILRKESRRCGSLCCMDGCGFSRR